MNATTGTTGRAATPAGNGGETAPPALPRHTMQAIVQDTYGRMGRRELLAGVPARESPKSAVTALVRAVLAAGTAVRPLETS